MNDDRIAKLETVLTLDKELWHAQYDRDRTIGFIASITGDEKKDHRDIELILADRAAAVKELIGDDAERHAYAKRELHNLERNAIRKEASVEGVVRRYSWWARTFGDAVELVQTAKKEAEEAKTLYRDTAKSIPAIESWWSRIAVRRRQSLQSYAEDAKHTGSEKFMKIAKTVAAVVAIDVAIGSEGVFEAIQVSEMGGTGFANLEPGQL